MLVVGFISIFVFSKEETIYFSMIIEYQSIIACFGTGSVLTSTLISDINNGTLTLYFVRSLNTLSILSSKITAIIVSTFVIILFTVFVTPIIINFLGYSIHFYEPTLIILMTSLSLAIFSAGLGLIIGTCVSSPATGMGSFIVFLMLFLMFYFRVRHNLYLWLVYLRDGQWPSIYSYVPPKFNDLLLIETAIFITMLSIMTLSLILSTKILKKKIKM
jgi:ABC-type transport system involved in multi-copper enzyme maturation permease subunit